jgi:hypothetical protein
MSRMSVRSNANSTAAIPLSHLPLTREQVLANLDLIATEGLMGYVDLAASLDLEHGFHYIRRPYVHCPGCVQYILQ